MKECYILFPNHGEGLRLEENLKTYGINYVIVPTPRELSLSCGISIKISLNDRDRVEELIKEKDIRILGIHELDKKNKDIKFI